MSMGRYSLILHRIGNTSLYEYSFLLRYDYLLHNSRIDFDMIFLFTLVLAFTKYLT